MKVLVLTEFYPPYTHGGGELSTQFLVNGLTEQGHEVIVLTSRYPEEKIERGSHTKIYRKLKTGKSVSTCFANIKREFKFESSVIDILPRIIRKEKPEVLHCMNTKSIESLGSLSLTIPVVATINNYRNICPKADLLYKGREECETCSFFRYISCMENSEYVGKIRLKKWMKYNPPFLIGLYLNFLKRRTALANVDHFIAISRFVRNVLVQSGVSPENISILSNVPGIKEKVSKPREPPKGKAILFCPTGLQKRAGVDILLKSLKYVKSDIATVITGEGPEEKRLKHLCRELNLERKVNFTGRVKYSEIQWYYKNCALVCMLPRDPEPLSRILLESTCFGKPIIATNVGGNSDGVINGENGYLVPKNPKRIAEKIDQLATNKELREKMGEKSKSIFKRKFEDEVVLAKIERLYKKLSCHSEIKNA